MAVSSCDESAVTAGIVRVEFEHDLDLLTERAAQQLGDLADQAVGVDAFRAQRLAAREGEQAPGQIGAAERGRKRVLDQLLMLGVRARSQITEQVEIADDDAEKIVEIMRHAAGQAADGLHLLRLIELRRRPCLPLDDLDLQLGGARADPGFEPVRVIVQEGFRRGEPAVQPAGLDEQRAEHKARREQP